MSIIDDFYIAGNEHDVRFLEAPNRAGKTEAGLYDIYQHAIRYTDDWKGKRLEAAWPRLMIMGKTYEFISDVIVPRMCELLANFRFNCRHAAGRSGDIRRIEVFSLLGERLSDIRFLSYEAAQQDWGIPIQDVIFLDERPEGAILYEASVKAKNLIMLYTDPAFRRICPQLFALNYSDTKHISKDEVLKITSTLRGE